MATAEAGRCGGKPDGAKRFDCELMVLRTIKLRRSRSGYGDGDVCFNLTSTTARSSIGGEGEWPLNRSGPGRPRTLRPPSAAAPAA
jgi:hypothetical protein